MGIVEDKFGSRWDSLATSGVERRRATGRCRRLAWRTTLEAGVARDIRVDCRRTPEVSRTRTPVGGTLATSNVGASENCSHYDLGGLNFYLDYPFIFMIPISVNQLYTPSKIEKT